MSSVPSGRAVVGADGGGELYESAELPRHLPAAGRQAGSARWTEWTAEVPGGPGARCVSNLTRTSVLLATKQAVIGQD